MQIIQENSLLRGKLLKHTSLASYTSWRVGGVAACIYLPADRLDLINFLKSIPPAEPILWLGLGSNTLIRDGGFRGTVIVTQGRLHNLSQLDNTTLRAEAGVACPAFARFSARLGLENAEFLAGIPGTMGGALAMNAGCHGGETWELVVAVETINRQGECLIRYPHEFQITYRNVKGLTDEWFLAGHFQLQTGVKELALERIRKLLDHRAATQPTSEPNCGSTFRNPPGDYAGRLIEACGLKGKRVGGASVSHKHANFIVTDQTAKAADVEQLIELIQVEVARIHGVHLIREVHVLGDN